MRSLAVVFVGMVVGCGGSDEGSGAVCGAGTHEESGVCVPDGQGPDGGAGADAGLPANAKLVFVTRATYRGDMGGVAGADSKCNAAAAGGSLGEKLKGLFGR